MPKKATQVKITENQKEILEKFAKGTKIEQHFKIRSQIILYASEDMSNTKIAKLLKINWATANLWRKRWSKKYQETLTIETESPKKLKQRIKEVFTDEYRAGRNPKFNPEQVAQIIYISLQKPEEYGLPFSNWTYESIAKQAVKLNIVESISRYQVRRFLKRSRLKTA